MALRSIKSRTKRLVGVDATQILEQYSRFGLTWELKRLRRLTGEKYWRARKIKPSFVAADLCYRQMIWLRHVIRFWSNPTPGGRVYVGMIYILDRNQVRVGGWLVPVTTIVPLECQIQWTRFGAQFGNFEGFRFLGILHFLL